MGNKARQYTQTTLKRLFLLSCNQCAAPDCKKSFEARDEKTIIAKICHIEAASSDGPRYNSNMTDDERRDFENLILLCDECHSIIDNKDTETKYTVLLLKEWKRSHEDKCRRGKLIKNPKLINQAINAIASIEFKEEELNDTSLNTFDINNKIVYNSVKEYKYIIEEYSKYYGKLNSLYSELENRGSFKKEKLLKIIRNLYLKIKGEIVNGRESEFEIIQQNADKILQTVEERIWIIIDKIQSNEDDVLIAIPIIIVDAFMRCKILEEPPKKA